MNLTKNLGMLMLAIYLLVIGVTGLFGIHLGALSFVIPLLAIVSGIVILMGK